MTLKQVVRNTIAIITLLTGSAVMAAPLKIGVSAVTAQSLEVAAAEAKKQGLDVEVIEFSDWTAPNTALAAGDLDANYFQHLPFLAAATKAQGYQLKAVDTGLLINLGLFSKKIKSIDAIPVGATVSVYDDATNQTRQLHFLQKLGLIKLSPKADEALTSIHDIVDNPKKLKFVEVPGPQLARAFDDVDLAVGASLFFVAAGRHDIAKGALAYSGAEDLKYAIHFVTRNNNANDPRIKQLIHIYQTSPAVKAQIHNALSQDAKLYTLPWVKPTTK
jgi:D-methionine transport system substrate-binding protein